MLTEGAKPGTPHITPRKIYPDGIDLFIEVNSNHHYHSHPPCHYNHIQASKIYPDGIDLFIEVKSNHHYRSPSLFIGSNFVLSLSFSSAMPS